MSLLIRTKLILVLLLLLAGLGRMGRAQVAFSVPEKVAFAGQTLYLDAGARAVVQRHGYSLVRNFKFYRSMTERADAYFPLIERVFREEGLPEEFKFLCIMESGLTSDVVSSSKAVGYWQFKAETATGVGLRVDNEIDERMNILASSRGAAKYLTHNNETLHNWTYALLSYYAGLGGCKAVVDMAKCGSRELSLDSATHPYILKFIAHKLAYEQAVNRSPNPSLQVMEYPECEGKTLRQIADETNVEMAQIEFYNKWCRAGVVPTDRDYTVLVPVKAADRPTWMAMTTRPTPALGENLKPWRERTFFGLIEKEPEPIQSENPNTPIFFAWNGIKAILARKADNINRLSLAAGVDKQDLMDYNDLRVFDLIVPGQVYYVKPKRRKSKVPFHTVRLGETVWEVAQNYGITLNALLKKNRMHSPEKLKTGRILWLRHQRSEDHPIEYDRAIQSSPAIPISSPVDAEAMASLSRGVPASAVVTQAPARPGPDGPTAKEVEQKYASVQTDEQAEQITVPLDAPADVAPVPLVMADKPTPAPETARPTPLPARPVTPAIPAPKTAPVAAPIAAAPIATPATAPITLPAPRRWVYGTAGTATHVVAPKETLYGIARQYGTTPAKVQEANPALAVTGLQPGTELVVPAPATASSTPAANAPAHAKPAPAASVALPQGTYVVATGDTFYGIAKRFGLTVAQLQALNHKTDTALQLGESLLVR